jgi:riboflavin biosynthesis pyrimidine reductase
VLVVEANERGNVDLHCLLGRLHAAGIESLLIEGGGGIITSALRQRLVDRLVVVIAPKLIGAGTEAVGDLGVGRLRDALGFASACFRLLDEDVVFEGHFDRTP